MQEMLQCALQHVIQAEAVEVKLFASFRAVRIADSSHIDVPAKFAEHYASCENQQGSSAGLKLQANLDLVGGGLRCEVQAGRESNHSSEVAFDCAEGELSVRDLGYFGVNHFEQFQQQRAFFLSRVPARSCLL
jgi:Transposase DDE domain